MPLARPMIFPSTGIPWLDALLQAGKPQAPAPVGPAAINTSHPALRLILEHGATRGANLTPRPSLPEFAVSQLAKAHRLTGPTGPGPNKLPFILGPSKGGITYPNQVRMPEFYEQALRKAITEVSPDETNRFAQLLADIYGY